MSNIGKDGNQKDRKLGEDWEDIFIKMVKEWGWEAWPFTRIKGATFTYNGKTYISPDVWVLRRKLTQYACEIKHKNLARNGCYGFEVYRERSLLEIEADYTNQFGKVSVLYVIHNHDMAGGKWVKKNNPKHWHAGILSRLASNCISGNPQLTYRGGKLTCNPVEIHYYPFGLFKSIEYFFCLND